MEKSLETIVETNNRMIQEGAKKYEIARELGFAGKSNCDASSALNKKLKKAKKEGFDVIWSKSSVVQASGSVGESVRDKNMSKLTFSHIPDKNPPVDILWKKRIDEFERVKAHADGEAKVTIYVDENKPIGLLLMGDPHIDNPGCNVPKLLSDVNLEEAHINYVFRLAHEAVLCSILMFCSAFREGTSMTALKIMKRLCR